MDTRAALSVIGKNELLAIGNDRLRRLATYASVGVSVTLIFGKLFAYLLTDSVAMLSSLLDSTIDLLAALVTAYGVATALCPPDRDHRFGHGKAEPLAALAQAAFIVGSSVLLGYESISRLYHPHALQNETLGYGVMGVAIILSLGLVQFQQLVVGRTSSMAIHADYLHYMGDVAINIAVVAAFVLYQLTGLAWLDPVFAMLISAGMGLSAWRIAVQALNVLMDKELPEDERARICTIVEGHPSVRGLHDMRTRSDGDRIFVELHVEMEASLTLRDAHDVAESIESRLRTVYPNVDLLIHQDPAGLKENRLDEQIAAREAAGM